MKTVILGSGISGISAGYHLEQTGEKVAIYEKDSDWGGLCGNFTINGFLFDKFVHLSFAKDGYINNLFEESSPLLVHPSISYNYYNGFWLKHPAQNNLAPLPTEEKVKIIESFVNRDVAGDVNNYEDWLRIQYGNYFAENFPFKYTKKYWGVEPKELETKWIGKRMYAPCLQEILRGAFEEQKENFYYTSEMRYPQKGGFRSILNNCRKGLDIRFNKEVVKIDIKNKIVKFKDKTETSYTRLISSLPLPEIVNMIDNVPSEIEEAGKKLRYTGGYMVSLGFSRPDIAKYLWFYIYDENILASRVYSPSLKSPNNAPSGCSSLQAEIFFSNREERTEGKKEGRILNDTIEALSRICNFNKSDIIVQDIRFEKYANIIFDKNIYTMRNKVLDFLAQQGIESIGRFGKWDYFWSHDAFESGRNVIQTRRIC